MSEFLKKQQECVDLFKHYLTKAFDESMSKFYCDVTPYAESDAHVNFKNALWDEVYNEFVNEIKSEYSMYSRAATIRKALLSQHKEELQNKIIEDLTGEIERQKQEMKQIYERFR